MYADFLYVYVSTYVVQIVHTNTSFAGKVGYAYVYGLCYLRGLCVRTCLLRVNRVMIQRLVDSFDVAMMFADSSNVAMTIVLDFRRFV